MKYNGIELEQMTPDNWDGKTRKMLAWDSLNYKPSIEKIVGYKIDGRIYWLDEYGRNWTYCAEIPKEEPNQVQNVDEMIKILNAYKKGKKIECRFKDRTMRDSWSCIEKPNWNWDSYEYRVKQEQQTKKTRIMTYQEVNDWLAKGNGQYKITGDVRFLYYETNKTVDCNLLIRGWGESDWHIPIVEE